MRATFLAAFVAVALSTVAAAQAGSTLTAPQYRSTVNALCAKAEKDIAALSTAKTAPVVTLGRALGLLRPMVARLKATAPPAALRTGHGLAVRGNDQLIAATDALIRGLRQGASLENAFAGVKAKFQASTVNLKAGYTQLGVEKCLRLVAG